MRSKMTLGLVLVFGLALTGSACGKYSINNLRALKAFQDANEKYQRAEYKGAVDDYERVVQLNPELGYAYFFLGNSYDNLFKPNKKGEPANDEYLKKAIENYRKAIDTLKGSTEPKAPEIRKLSFQYLIAAYAPDKMNDLDQALPVAQELISMEPNEPTNYQALGKLYEDAGRYEEAEAQFKKAIEVRPNDALGYATLAGFYNRQGEFDKTMDAFETRAKMEPTNPEAWHTMAPYYSEKAMKDFKLPKDKAKAYVLRGIEVEDKAIELNPNYFEAMIYKGILLRQQANLEKDRTVQLRLLDEADKIKAKAEGLQKKAQAAAGKGK
jgi:tetratricopeptide (TPR) repeat protein